jgi:hypothetical protein
MDLLERSSRGSSAYTAFEAACKKSAEVGKTHPDTWLGYGKIDGT